MLEFMECSAFLSLTVNGKTFDWFCFQHDEF